MIASPLSFRHEVIDADPPGSEHDITLLADLTGNGLCDVIIGGKRGEVNLFWYENPGRVQGGWARHDMAAAPDLEAGGVILDVDGDGRPDIIAGQQIGGNELYWFQCPPDPRDPWRRRVIEDRFEKYHDQALGDVDGDGEVEIVFLSQRCGVLAYYDIPTDPTVEPWPPECFRLVAEGLHDVEGLVVVDIDGDGRNEIIAGTHIAHPPRSQGAPWRLERYLDGYEMTRVAVADLTGGGCLDIIVCEGESDRGRLAVCSPPDWEPLVLRDGLFHPHSLQIGDFDGDGRPDILVAEMGLGRNPDPEMVVFLNAGQGTFQEALIQWGVPTHEAKIADLTGSGLPDIVGKPYHPERHIDVWYNQGQG